MVWANVDNQPNQGGQQLVPRDDEQPSQLPSGFPTAGEALLSALFQNSSGFIEIRMIKQGQRPLQHFYSDIASLDWKLLKQCNEAGYAAYFGVCLRKEKKGDKHSVVAVPALWCDLDAKDFEGGKDEALAQLNKLSQYLYPSIIVDSGHGFHCYWLLREAEDVENDEDIVRIEGYLKGLARTLRGDSTYDLGRMLRMPGTLNHKELQNPCVCQIAHWEPERRYNLSDFELYYVEVVSATENVIFSGKLPEVDIDALELSRKTRALMNSGWTPDCGYKTRSEADQAVITALLEAGCDNNDIRVVFSNSDLGIGEKYRESDDKYLAHSIANARAYLESQKSGKEDKQGKDRKSAHSQAQQLVEHAIKEGIYLFKNEHGDAWGRIIINEHFENLNLNSKDFRHYLGRLLYQKEGKAANSDAIRSAVLTLSGEALFGQTKRHPLYNRVAWHEGAIYYDLSDEMWRALKVTPEGWEVIEQPPILFRRYKRQIPQVEPLKGGDPFLLLELVRVKKEDQLLLLVYAISCLIPDIPHPILWVQGPEGSAKSGLCRILAKIIDPSSQSLLTMPNQLREMVQQLDHAWLAIFDNVQGLTDWQADSLCRAVTGDGFTKRELYSDDDDVIYAFKRCVGLNAINLDTDRPDLLDRTIILHLEAIPDDERATEDALQRKLEQLQTSIVGGFFDTLSKAMAIRPQVQLAVKPRMADFAVWGCAICEALGHSQKEFLDAYNANIRRRRRSILDEDVVSTVLLRFLQSKPTFEGTATELLNQLTGEAEAMGIITKARGWPKAPNALSRQLNVLKVNLEKDGIRIESLKDVGQEKSRGLKISKKDDNDEDSNIAEVSSISPSSSQAPEIEAASADNGETIDGDEINEGDDIERRCLASRDDGDDVSIDSASLYEKEPEEIEF